MVLAWQLNLQGAAGAGTGSTLAGYSNYAEFVARPDRTDVFLTILAPREPRNPRTDPIAWVNHSGNAWKTTYPINADEFWNVWDVFQNGTSLTPAASIAACISTAGTWYFDLETERTLYVHCDDSVDPNSELMQIAPAFCFATEKPWGSEFAPVFDLSLIKDIVAPYQLFELRLSENGLSEIGQELESPYYGVTVPKLQSIEIINGKTQYTDTAGRMDKYIDRFQWRDCSAYLYHGDGGTVLGLDEHLYLDQYRVMKVSLDDETFRVEFDSSASILTTKIPKTYYANDAGEVISYKSIFYGHVPKMAAQRISPRVYYFAGHGSDAVLAVYVDDTLVAAEDYVVNLTLSRITFDSPIDESATVTVTARRNVDLDGNAGAAAQYPGAMIRHFLNVYAGIPLSELPVASFQTLDAHAIPVHRCISGDSQTTIGAELDVWLPCVFSWLRRAQGIWEVYRFDPLSLRGSVATISEDEIISVKKDTDRNAIFSTIRINYSVSNEAEGVEKAVTVEHPTAGLLFEGTELFQINPSILNELEDAEELADLFGLITGEDQRNVAIEATGEIFKAHPGDIVKVTRTKGFDDTGVWNDREFIVKSITKRCLGSPGTVEAILVEPATEVVGEVSIGNISKATGANVSSVTIAAHQPHASTTKLCVDVYHRVKDASPTTVVTGVTAGGVALTQIQAPPGGSAIMKGSRWRLDSPTVSGPLAIVATCGAAVETMHVVAFDIIGATVDEAEGYTTATNTDVIQTTVATSSDALVVAGVGFNEHADSYQWGPGQVSRWNTATPDSTGSWTSTNSSISRGCSKKGAATTAIKLTEDRVHDIIVMIVTAFRP